MGDGHLNICSECTKKRVARHRDSNLDRIKEYDRNRPNADSRLADNKLRHRIYNKMSHVKVRKAKWRRDNKEKVREINLRYTENNMDIRKAHGAVGYALKKGILKKPRFCSRCGKEGIIHGHHWSYLEEHRLDVEWLCPVCHGEAHRTD